MEKGIDFKSRIAWKKHEGKDYLYADFRELNDPELLLMHIELGRVLEKQEPNSVLMFKDTTGLNVSNFSFYSTRKYVNEQRKFINRSAGIGLGKYTSFYPVYQKIIKSPAKFFDSEKDALDYLFRSTLS